MAGGSPAAPGTEIFTSPGLLEGLAHEQLLSGYSLRLSPSPTIMTHVMKEQPCVPWPACPHSMCPLNRLCAPCVPHSAPGLSPKSVLGLPPRSVPGTQETQQVVSQQLTITA